MNAAEVFLRALFGAAPPEYFILVWTLPDKRSSFFPKVTEELLAYVEDAKTRGDVYVGVGLRQESRGAYKRGKASEVVVLLGLWADLDFAGEGHSKTDLPRSLEEAVDLAASLPVRPTMLVNTGGGLHSWWLFKEPWDISTERERKDALDLVWRWQQTVKEYARRRGLEVAGQAWEVDSVHDLARVLRVPGTQNRKVEPYRDVVFVQEPDERLRYDPSEFDQFLIDCEDAPPSADPTQFIDASLPPIEEVEERWPIRKWKALCSNDPKFKTTWDNKRQNLKDKTPSGYDLALANFMVGAEWSDQEIVDALIYRRKERKDGLKRLDYYAYTIRKARESKYAEKALDQLKEDMAAGEIEDPLAAISDHLGIHIKKVIRFNSQTPTFDIHTDQGALQKLTAKQIHIFGNFQEEMLARLKHTIPHTLQKEWKNIWTLVIAKSEDDLDFSEDADEDKIARERIENYLAENGPMPDMKDAMGHNRPYIKNGTVWIYGGDFRAWMTNIKSEAMNQNEFGQTMRAYGAKSSAQDITIHGGRTTRMYWYLPQTDFVKTLVETILDAPPHTVGQPISTADTYQEQPSGGVNGTNGHAHTD